MESDGKRGETPTFRIPGLRPKDETLPLVLPLPDAGVLCPATDTGEGAPTKDLEDMSLASMSDPRKGVPLTWVSSLMGHVG
jgi:hypothetical protein